MPRRKLPIFTERTLSETKADRIAREHAFDEKLPRVSCRVGCSACCYHAVFITITEGILLYQALARRGQWTPSFRKRVQEHADKTWDLAPEVWHLMNLACPLLENAKCIAYDARPFACRTIATSGDPYYCHPHRVAAASFVPRKEALNDFYAEERRRLRRHGLDLVLLPLSKALLIGEKIGSGDEDIEQFLRLLAQEMA